MSRIPDSQWAVAKTTLPGLITAIGVAAILFARDWWMLAVGWCVLGVFFVMLLLGWLRSQPSRGPVRFRIGPAIAQTPLTSATWLVPVGVLVLLLGIAGLLIPAEETPVAEKYGWGLFLTGVGIACFGIAFKNRRLLAAGYALWCAAGLAMAALAVPYGSEPVQVARLLTLGVLIALGGGAAAWSFWRGTTPVYDDGIRYGSTLCGWDTVDSWSIIRDGHSRLLSLSVGDGKWKPLHHVAAADAADLEAFLRERTADHPKE